MIIYQVNIRIDKNTEKDYLSWLHNHVGKMLEIDGFKKAEVFKELEEGENWSAYVVNYEVESVVHLDKYFKGPAAEMRSSAEDKFSGKYSISRRVLQPQGT